MLVRIFTLRFDPATEHFDDSPMMGFVADKEVLSIHDHFFIRDDVPYLVLVVQYRAAAIAARPETARAGPQRDESWREMLSEADLPLFNTLRAWRGERAKQEGIPPYVICNNRQLAELINARPSTVAALGRLEGFGEAKLKKYGKDLLALIAGQMESRTEDTPSRVRSVQPRFATAWSTMPCAMCWSRSSSGA
jgi:hypothetical protein